jgi:hypothetical protein
VETNVVDDDCDEYHDVGYDIDDCCHTIASYNDDCPLNN